MTLLLTLALLLGIRDIDGVERQPMKPAKGHAEALFFIAHDCPISNYYAHEIRRICDEYSARGLGCTLIYVDPTMKDADARKHAADYGHGAYPKVIDRQHELVAATKATITPEAVVVKDDGSIGYKGRIDNYYAALGKPRRVVTQHDLRDAIEAVLAGRKVLAPETQSVGCYIPSVEAYK